MKTFIIKLVLLLFGITSISAHGTTNVVVVGNDLQLAINASSPGDTLVVQSGAYSGNLNFTKPLTLLCSGTNGIQLSGNTSIQSPGPVAFSQVQFLGSLTVQSNALSILNQSTLSSAVSVTGGTLQAFDCSFAGLSGTGGKLILKRCTFSGAINLAGTSLEALRVTNLAGFTATATYGTGTRFIATQSSFGYTSITGYSVWLGYTTFVSPSYNYATILSLNFCDTILVGISAFDMQSNGWPAAFVTGGTLNCFNSRFYKYFPACCSGLFVCSIQLESVTASLQNCSISVRQDAHPQAIRAQGTAVVRIRNCAVRAEGGTPPTGIIVYDSAQINEVSYCCVWGDGGSSPLFLSGVSSANSIYGEPNFDSNLNFVGSSPCINAGNPSSLYNNTDGSRNTIGWTGGPLYNPANYTNNNPIVFWLGTSNQTVLKGVQNTIPITIGASAGH